MHLKLFKSFALWGQKLSMLLQRRNLASMQTSGNHKNDQMPLHHPVMTKEVLENLYPTKGDIILDLTFGAGGHTRAILEKCKDCRVIALDRDPLAHGLAQSLSEEYKYRGRIVPLLGRFSELELLLQESGITLINGAILDAGCSSMQLETATRGFSLAKDGPLDMRMDGYRVPSMPSAADVVNRLSAKDLANILEKYGEERYAQKIARHIVFHRGLEGPITRTRELADVIAGAFHFDDGRKKSFETDSLNRRRHVATKSFMAIRIFVNNELNELYAGLKTAEKYMSKGGRLVAITFHSLEDKIVKRVLSGVGINEPFGASLHQKRSIEPPDGAKDIEKNWMILKKIVMPQFDEVDKNARSRSAKLRSATRI